jgi:hypothetical protein
MAASPAPKTRPAPARPALWGARRPTRARARTRDGDGEAWVALRPCAHASSLSLPAVAIRCVRERWRHPASRFGAGSIERGAGG